jgi:hypothetical protein
LCKIEMENDSQTALSPDTGTEMVSLEQTPQFARLRARRDGWTPERQRHFIEVLAACGLVREAAAAVGMSTMAAYKLRNRSEGRNFALAWDAALIKAREVLVDVSIDRAFNGTVTRTIKDGEVVKEVAGLDNRLLLATLTRLDTAGFRNPAARIVAQELDEFLDCLERDAASDGIREEAAERVGSPEHLLADDPARSEAVGFLEMRGERGSAAGYAIEQNADVMRRLTRYGVQGAAFDTKIPTDDLDPNQLESWTLEQWQRATLADLFPPDVLESVGIKRNLPASRHSRAGGTR